ncbi:glycosyltransferase [Kineococcus sp. NPDC059986]|uniref:glycosyltransferase n=1 Tax=Kineococcus sp. NPDC059986 TaxID=3155538 RepID=UPI00344F5837
MSAYPTISHAFIEREVTALRDLGVIVHTFSVRPSPPSELLSRNAREEARTTTALLGRGRTEYLRTIGRLVHERPSAVVGELARALSTGPRSAKARVWQVFYLVEAAVLRQELLGRGVRHVHVHFANNGADIARRVVSLGRALDGPDAGWSWSFSMHGPTEFADPERFDLPAKASSASAIACISDYCRREVLSGVPAAERPGTAIVRMSVDADRFPGRADARRDRAAGALRILFVGRLVGEKGPEVLLEATDHLRLSGVEVDVVVVGRGPLEAELRQAVVDRNLGDVVRLVGAVGQDELPDWYAWADVFCLPSYEEGVPVVLMEAMSSELPVVTTRIAGIPELVDNESGTLVEAGDASAVAAALARYASDPELRESAGRAGRKRVRSEFAPLPNAEALLDLFRSSTSARPVALVEGSL